MSTTTAELKKTIQHYIAELQLKETALALQILEDYSPLIKEQEEVDYYQHNCLSIAVMLIDLHLPLTLEEQDYCFASAILHTISKHAEIHDFGKEMKEKYGLSDRVIEIVDLITIKKTDFNDLDSFYGRMEFNKLALLVRLTERSNMVERLYTKSDWNAKLQILETKTYFLPMCIYAKEHYPELIQPISLLMEKMRCLMDVAEILMNKFELQQNEMHDEILRLKEENARIRVIIKKLKE